ncbi:hypothetical protein BX666DRAFT_1854823 [Dichotomocladium elegans]|nr:hypothetical protein BX666DRAFT_1854823 [Dichotomocladium elegans]
MAHTQNRLSQDKRSKVTLACTICRKKKVKCDGNQPTCDRCNMMGIVCHYSTEIKKRGPIKRHVEIINNRAHRILLLNQQQQQHQHHQVSLSQSISVSASEKMNSPATIPVLDQKKSNLVFRTIADAPRDYRLVCFSFYFTI